MKTPTATPSSTKTDFIKFNVSPKLKKLATKKAAQYGMSLSELGRMLFGAYVTGLLNENPLQGEDL